MSPRAMIDLIITVTALISPTVLGSLVIPDHDFPLMYYTKLISEEHFAAGRPLVIMLPIFRLGAALSLVDSSNKEGGYLMEELHKSGRWQILVYNMDYKMNGNTYTEMHQHGGYITLTSVPCPVWKYHILSFSQQVQELIFGNNTKDSWNPRANFIVSVMSNCTQFDNKLFSREILLYLWYVGVMKVTVLFLKSNEHAGNDLQQNTTDSAQGTYLELHTWYPYENSDRCSPADGTVPVKVFTVRNLSEFRRSEIFRGYFDKNFHGCPINVLVRELPLPVYSTGHMLNKNSNTQHFYVHEWEVELVRVIGKAHNMSLHIVYFVDISATEELNNCPIIFMGMELPTEPTMHSFVEYARSYLSLCFVWYTPCAVKYQRWSRFFDIFSVDMWICFVLSLVLAVITVRCISNYGHKSHLHQCKSYSNIFSVTANIIAVLLSVSVNTQPRSAPLRLFFFCWVCYSVAISTVFKAYLTTFLIEPGYEEPIRTVEEMLKSKKMFGLAGRYNLLFTNTSDPVYSAIVKDAVQCPDESTCFIWAAVYHNISTLIKDLDVETYRAMGNWTDENNRPLLCEMEGGFVRTFNILLAVQKGFPFFEFVSDVFGHIIEGGIFMHIKKRNFDKVKIESKLDVPTFHDTYYAINIRQLQTAFYLLFLGYVSAVACFMTEIMWHYYRSKGHGPTVTTLCHGRT